MLDYFGDVMEGLGASLSRRTSATGPVARIGALLTGSGAPVALPVDRRAKNSEGARGRQQRAHPRGGERPVEMVPPSSCHCTDPQYCYLHGRPCKCCGGSDKACPPGTVAGGYWAYCCSHTMIWFRDCCGSHTCPTGTPWCHNSTQPNWCNGKGGNVYVCTLAENHGHC